MSSEFQPESYSRVEKALTRSKAAFEPHRAVFDAVADRMLARLPLLALTPLRILDLGARDDALAESLQAVYPGIEITLLGAGLASSGGSAAGWKQLMPFNRKNKLTRLNGDPHQLPFDNDSFDLIVSNLMLPWCHSPHLVFSEVARVMTQQGAFMFSSAGPDTLMEYRSRWAQIDTYPHSFGLMDMHDLGDAMLKHGLTAPVLDRENITVSFPDLAALETELQAVGAVNLARGRRPGLMSSSVRRRLVQNFPNGPINITLELVQGHAWKNGLQSLQQTTKDGVVISLDSVRDRLRGRKNRDEG